MALVNGRRALLVVGVIGAGLVVSALRGSAGATEPAGSQDEQVQGMGGLGMLVRELAAAWNPKERERVLERARPRMSGLEPAVLAVLAQPEHEMFAAVVELASDAAMLVAREPIEEAARSGPIGVRPACVRAADRILPWTDEDLLDFLDEPEPDVIVAALQALATHDSRPVALLLRVLGHEEPAVREAALAALPRELQAADIGLLLERLEQGGEPAFAALQVLAQAEWTEQVERSLWQRFPGLDDESQVTILDACIKKRHAPAAVPAVWDVAFGPGDHEVRTRALRCLEMVGAHDPASLRDAVAALPNRLRYHGARCLLRNRDLQGVELLIQLADDASAEAEEQLAAKEVLAQVTGVPMHFGVAAWRRWLDVGPSLPAKVLLPAAPL